MTRSIKKLAITLALRCIVVLRRTIPLVGVVVSLLLYPFFQLWKRAVRPVALVIYRHVVVFRQRFAQYIHAQHKLLAVITHRFAIHVLVVLLTAGVVSVNMFNAKEVRAEEFAEGSLVSKIFRPDEETVVTAEATTATPSSYINTSASIKRTPTIGESLVPTTDGTVATTGGGGALVKTNVLGDTDSNRNSIQQYVVQQGDTVSTIAALFGVSTQTLLWSNNLSDSSLIKPGQTLYILPTSGVAHTVRSGETVEGLASKYNASVDDILNYNNLIKGSDLAAGDEIIIPGGRQPAPVVVPTTRLASVRDVFGSSSSAPASASSVAGGSYQWPTSCRRISQYYGYRHTGIDIDCEFGDPIYAAESGTVSSAGWYSGYGLQIVVSHSNGTQTRYAHLQKVFVSAGDSVSKGQGIGEMGSTGWSSGSHVHFEVISNGRTYNPFSYL